VSTVLANPAEMMAKGAPRVIHTEDELEAYTDALFQLTGLENPTPSEEEAIELLTLLIERYEREHYPIPEAEPVSILRYLIQKQNLTQRDLVPEFGSESAVSMFMTEARPITLEQIRRLSARFNLPADIFMPKKKLAARAAIARAARR
jgi:HTH-type transcriptional regulator / antitoxin HigA